MKNPIGVALIVCLLCTHFSYSQPICGFDALHGKSMNTDASYRRIIKDNETRLQHIITEQRARKLQPPARISATNAPIYVIPVVVHVLHTGDAEGSLYNPGTANITAAIDFLNQAYNGTMPGGEGVGDVQIQFALATRDPNCNATNGINRVDASVIPNYEANGVNADSTNGASELAIKDFTRWDPYSYYNIYVVNKIDGKDGNSVGQFIAGYARLPQGSPALDGTVMLASQMDAGYKTLPHEIGHALFLYHPFQGSNNATHCPAETNCNAQGDGVCDTDPITFNASGGMVDFSCRTGTNTCAPGAPNYSINTEHNFMNYTSCFTLFTAGQKTRMLAAMSLAGRREYSGSWALPGTYPITYTQPAINCAPVTSATGVSDHYAGIYSIAVANKIFTTGSSSMDGGFYDRTDYCINLVSMYANATYTFSTELWGANYEQVSAWIDFNNNGTFETAERILRDDTIPNTNPVASATFTVPANAVTNQVLRMRVMEEISSHYPPNYFITGPCYNPVYGQAEDYPVIISPSTLPVTWAYFKGNKQDNTVKLLWKTSSEINTSYFDVERSYNGSDYTKIGEVEARGISSGSTYSYDDNDFTGPVMYYRLKQVDVNGQFTYTNIVTIKNETVAGNSITILNNPFRDRLDINISTPVQSKVVIHLLDATGKLVHTQTAEVLNNTTLQVTPGIGNLSAGLYIIKVTLNGKTVTRKVIKE